MLPSMFMRYVPNGVGDQRSWQNTGNNELPFPVPEKALRRFLSLADEVDLRLVRVDLQWSRKMGDRHVDKTRDKTHRQTNVGRQAQVRRLEKNIYGAVNK